MKRQTNVQETMAIVGVGRVGLSLKGALAYVTKGAMLHSFSSSRSIDAKALARNGGPQVLIIAVKDDMIAEVAKRAMNACGPNLRLIVHLAGSQPSTILPYRKGIERLVLHPIQSFPKPSAKLFEGISFAAASDDAEALTWAKTFVKLLRAKEVLILPNKSLPLYHAMLVLGANTITLLLAVVEELAGELDLDPPTIKKAMTPLLRSSLENALRQPAMTTLTGPFSRADTESIKAHKRALKHSPKTIRAIYKALEAFAQSKL
jgi:predicted short-subunit dehydrogenase-like oxidoreductase (DUF2520 family)